MIIKKKGATEFFTSENTPEEERVLRFTCKKR
jgi:hypothetical protein